MEKNKHKIKVKFFILSPLHIGTGETISSFEFLKKENYLYFIKFDKLIDFLVDTGKFGNDVVKVGEQFYKYFSGESKSLNKFFEDNAIDKNKFLNNEKNYLYKIEFDKNIGSSNQSIEECIKTVNYNAYIPGSSIKGMIRNAITYNYIKNNGNLKQEIKNEIIKNNNFKDIDNYINNKIFCFYSYKKKKENPHKKDVLKIFSRTNPQNDIFRFIEIEDVMSDKLNITVLKGKSITKNEKEKLPVISEYITNFNDEFSFNININVKTIFHLMKNNQNINDENVKEKYDKFKMIFKRLFNINEQDSEEIILTKIKSLIIESLSIFGNDLFNYTKEFFNNSSDKIKTIKEINNQKFEKGIFIAELGKQNGFYAKTISLLFKDDKNVLEKIIRTMKKANINNFPSTKYIIFKENQTYLPGWIYGKVI